MVSHDSNACNLPPDGDVHHYGYMHHTQWSHWGSSMKGHFRLYKAISNGSGVVNNL